MKTSETTVVKAGLLTALWLGTAVQVLAVTPLVSNVRVAQRAGTKLVDITYDLTSTQTNLATVSIVLSNATGILNASHYSGDIGQNVAMGTDRIIVWDGGADLNGQNADNLRAYLTVTIAGGQSGADSPAGMSLIPAGTFNMGNSIATPIHPVDLTAFYMDQTEVTKGTWDAVYAWAATNGYSIANAGGKAPDHPAQNLQWHSALKWCNARSEREGLTPCYTNANGSVFKTGYFSGGCNWAANGYRLPTEAQWEYAARGTGTTNRFPWTDSNEIQHTRANYWSTSATPYDTSLTRGYHPAYTNTGKPYTSPVGSFAPNAYGLYDMAGNVYEWCWDWYAAPYRTTPRLNPTGPASGNGRVIRGGGWGGDYPSAAYVCDVAYRNYNAPDGIANSLGFRCVRAVATAPTSSVVASDPFAADFRDYTLTVISAFGSPTPQVGSVNYAWGACVFPSVEKTVCVNGKYWTCTGWTGTGSVPASGCNPDMGPIELTSLTSTITWQWTEVTGFSQWIAANELTGDPSVLFEQDADQDGIPNGLEFALGTNLTAGTRIIDLRLVNGRRVIEIPIQDANTLPYVALRVKGCTNLLCGPEGWTLSMVPAADATGKPEDRAWFEVTGAPDMAFFRLEAELLP